MDLYYQSRRGSLLAPFIKRLLSAIADKLYHTPVEIKILEVSDKGAQFHIHFVPPDTRRVSGPQIRLERRHTNRLRRQKKLPLGK